MSLKNIKSEKELKSAIAAGIELYVPYGSGNGRLRPDGVPPFNEEPSCKGIRYFVISACKDSSRFHEQSDGVLRERTRSEIQSARGRNKGRMEQLKRDVLAFHSAYLPLNCGFSEETGAREEVYESLYVVTHFMSNGSERWSRKCDFEKLHEFAIKVTAKYDQPYMLITNPEDGVPTYYHQDGSVESVLTKNTNMMDAASHYFGRLHGQIRKVDLRRLKMNPSPQTINGLRVRRMKGEICHFF